MIAVIVPIYNTEKYLRETIDSVICQTLSFAEHIRLILLDDASTDGSFAICEQYQKQYPKQILVKHYDTNQGVSALRNEGVRIAGEMGDELITFLDSDDKLADDAMEKAVQYFDAHEDVFVAAIGIRYFDAYEGEQRLNWRFEKTDVVDIKKDYTYPHYYVGGVFLRHAVLDELHFDESLSFWEDALAVNQVIVSQGKYGLIAGTHYYYRKREDESSLVDTAWHKKERYTTLLSSGYGQLFAYSRKKHHRIIPYVQYMVAYHMRLMMMKVSRALSKKFYRKKSWRHSEMMCRRY